MQTRRLEKKVKKKSALTDPEAYHDIIERSDELAQDVPEMGDAPNVSEQIRLYKELQEQVIRE